MRPRAKRPRAMRMLTATALRVLRDIRSDGGMEIHNEVRRRAAGQLVLAGCARKLKTKYAITAAGSKLLRSLEPPTTDTRAW